MYITYKITNKITQEFYFGSHKTDNPYDTYMGSGQLIKKSISEYGVKNHKKEVIGIFQTRQESLELERQLIRQFKNNPKLLNKSFGGQSFDYINENLTLDRKAMGGLASHEWATQEKHKRINEYNKNPKHCIFCGNPLPYHKRINKFCSSSCSAKYNNPKKIKKIKIKKIPDKYCKYCNTKLKRGSRNTFCNNKCSALYYSKNRKPTKLQECLLNDKEKIIKLHENLSYREIAKLYDTSATTIKDLLKGKFDWFLINK